MNPADLDAAISSNTFSLDTAPPSNTDPLTALLHAIAKGNNSAFQPVQDDPAHDED